MQVVVQPLRRSGLFAAIQWDTRRQLWDSRSYRELIDHDLATIEPAVRSIWLDSISSESDLFKASIDRVRIEQNPAGGVDLVIECVSRDGNTRVCLRYGNVALLQCSGLMNFLVGGELLGHELTVDQEGWRHALLFIADEYAVIQSESVSLHRSETID
jgi:hypothetical protein